MTGDRFTTRGNPDPRSKDRTDRNIPWANERPSLIERIDAAVPTWLLALFFAIAAGLAAFELLLGDGGY